MRENINEILNKKKIKSLSKEGWRELWPPQEGMGYVFQTRIGKGGIIFTSKFFWGGSVLKHYTFLKTTPLGRN